MFVNINAKNTHYVSGVPILGLYPIDPLRINSLGIDQGGGPVNIKLNFRDLDISNIGSAVIRELQWVELASLTEGGNIFDRISDGLVQFVLFLS